MFGGRASSKASTGGFQPMEMDLAAFDDEFDDDDDADDLEGNAYFQRRGGGGKRKKGSILWKCMACLLLVAILIAGGGFAYMKSSSQKNTNTNDNDKNPINNNSNNNSNNNNNNNNEMATTEPPASPASPTVPPFVMEDTIAPTIISTPSTVQTTTSLPTVTPTLEPTILEGIQDGESDFNDDTAMNDGTDVPTTTISIETNDIDEEEEEEPTADGEEKESDMDGENDQEGEEEENFSDGEMNGEQEEGDGEDLDGEEFDGENETSTSNNVTPGDGVLQPPMAHREEDRRVYFGTAPPNWDTDIPRQADDSKYTLIDPPIALEDPYGWLRHHSSNNDDDFPLEILDYLHAENNYTHDYYYFRNNNNNDDNSNDNKFGELQDKIFQEFKFAIKETYFTVPQQSFQDGYYYYQRTMKDISYPFHCRAPVPTVFDETNESTTTAAITSTYAYLAHHIHQWDGTPESPILPGEIVWLNENELVQEQEATAQEGGEEEDSKSYLEIGDIAVSPDGTWVAYTVDDTGNELYHLVIEEIDTHKVVLWGGHGTGYDQISSTVVWGKDRTTLFIVQSDDAQRDSQVYQCTIHLLQEGMMGSNSMDCTLIFEELEVEYWVSIDKTLDQRYLLITTASSDTSEVLYLDLETILSTVDDTDNNTDEPEAPSSIKRIAHRNQKVLYSIDYGNGIWWMLTNVFKKTEFDLLFAPVGSHDWESIHGETSDGDIDTSVTSILQEHYLDDVTVLQNHLIIQGRIQPMGLPQIWIATLNEDDHHTIESVVPLLKQNDDDDDENGESCYNIDFLGSENGSFNTSHIIVEYQSLTTPTQEIVIDLYDTEFEIPIEHMTAAEEEADEDEELWNEKLIRERSVRGYDKRLFGCQRILVPSRMDESTGEMALIPVSLVYQTSTMSRASEEMIPVPMHLYAYGAYGVSIEDDFVSSRLPLIGRGMIYAIAHVRGGGELGQGWYDDGKLLNKTHTFDDLIDVANYFVDTKQWTTPDLLSLEGRSAGGLTVGATINRAPDLFRAAILGVPFVDVMATMSDASIPLTALEWLEWGNPNEEEYFEYMKSYSPVNNVASSGNVVYPSMLLLAGLYDPRVAYWEPAKFTATLRYNVANDPMERPIFLKTDMSSGHFSASDRYKYLEGKAFEYAFLLDQLDLYD